MEKIFQEEFTVVKQLIYNWIKKESDTKSLEWLDKKIELVKSSDQKKDIFLAYNSASRFVGKNELQLTSQDLKMASHVREGWNPTGWRADEAARILLILSISSKEERFFLEVLKQLFETAEVSELRALYLGLPLYPYPEKLKTRAIEGFRTNINIVFNAIALNNPFPKNFLDEAAWNQMVLKAVFIGSPLYKIQGIDERANATLARILSDFAHERWAAKRTVTPELWRSIGPFINKTLISDLETVISSEDELQKKAAILALSASQLPEAKKILNQLPDTVENSNVRDFSWIEIGEEWEKRNG